MRYFWLRLLWTVVCTFHQFYDTPVSDSATTVRGAVGTERNARRLTDSETEKESTPMLVEVERADTPVDAEIILETPPVCVHVSGDEFTCFFCFLSLLVVRTRVEHSW